MPTRRITPVVEKITQDELRNNGKMLQRLGRKHGIRNKPLPWHHDLGRSPYNFRRMHAVVRKLFPHRSLKGKKVVQMGAGNGVYMHLLAKEFGVHPTTIELNRRHVSKARREGIHANHLVRDARRTKLSSNSQDLVLCDHFVFARNFSTIPEKDVAASREVLREAFRILKPGKFLVLERVSPTHDGERDYLNREKLEGFEVMTHLKGLHDFPTHVIKANEPLGLSRLDLHDYFDLVVLQKPHSSQEKHFFTPLDLFGKEL